MRQQPGLVQSRSIDCGRFERSTLIHPNDSRWLRAGTNSFHDHDARAAFHQVIGNGRPDDPSPNHDDAMSGHVLIGNTPEGVTEILPRS